ncbi:MAG TPA: enoyl-CoA hydratase-related protein [Caulobacteraceae bacterium]|jgi:enoyl-CoA hydratase|nr:enoyl-CoA hydratase-related protein [Caulobacteraceae bacterium]
MELTRIIYQPGRIARVILNRTDKLNAQSVGLLAEMDWAFNDAVADASCRVIVLSGNGRAFSAGHDLTSDDQQASRRERYAGTDHFAQGLLSREIYTDSHLRWRDLPKPTIAMVHGYCIYGGWMIAAAMDIVYAADDAVFVPTYGDYFTTAWDVGSRKAKELLFGNRIITAAEAMAFGFVNRTFPAQRLEDETLRYASRVADQDPGNNRLVKFAINQAEDGMGFSQSVRAVGASFITRAPAPAVPSPAPLPTGTDQVNYFRRKVTEAMAYLREDEARAPAAGEAAE